MDDSSEKNYDTVGHRRWCLSPWMGKTGFGSYKGFSCMWSMDHSNQKTPPFDYVAYPAPGLFPLTHFSAGYVWSVELNEEKYAAPVEQNTLVTVTPVQVQIGQNKLERTAEVCPIDHQKVDVKGYGDIHNCIIFRPSKLSPENGAAYLVEIAGLKTKAGKAASVKYVVEFFTP